MVTQKTNHRWTTQVHAVGSDWVAQYASRTADNSIVAVYELLGDDAQTRAAVEPFTLSADALGSSPHFAAGHVGTLGIARGSNLGRGHRGHVLHPAAAGLRALRLSPERSPALSGGSPLWLLGRASRA